jgi:NUMOD3 motif
MKHYTYVLVDPRDDTVFYVGKGINGRLHSHFRVAKGGRHENGKCQRKIRKILSLGLEPIAEKLFEHEDEWPAHANEVAAIAFYGRKQLCNLTDGGDGVSGYEYSAVQRVKIGVRMASETGEKSRRWGKKHSSETLALLSIKHLEIAKRGPENWMFGKTLPPEQRAVVSAAQKANWEKLRELPNFDELMKERYGQPGDQHPCYGKPMSEAQKAKLLAANLGRKASPETRQKMSKAHSGEKNGFFGKTHSPETKSLLSAGKLGKPRSLQSRKKQSESVKGEKNHRFGKSMSPKQMEILRKANKGRKLSKEHKAKLGRSGEANPFFGKKHSAESAAKISEANSKMSKAQRQEAIGMIKAGEKGITIAKLFNVTPPVISRMKSSLREIV